MMNYPMYGGNYGPQYQQNLQPTSMPVANQKPVDERLWVQSEAQAEAYLVAPNSFVRLWHISEPVFYEKGCDGMGRPTPMTAFRYEKIENQQVLTADPTEEYKAKINELETRIKALESREVADAECE